MLGNLRLQQLPTQGLGGGTPRLQRAAWLHKQGCCIGSGKSRREHYKVGWICGALSTQAGLRRAGKGWRAGRGLRGEPWRRPPGEGGGTLRRGERVSVLNAGAEAWRHQGMFPQAVI